MQRTIQHMTPGYYLAVGPEGTEVRRVKPLSDLSIRALPHQHSWVDYDYFKLLGYVPNSMVKCLIQDLNRKPTVEEINWLSKQSTSTREAVKWIMEQNDATSTMPNT